MDALSDVLRTIHIEGALFLHAELGAPWCVDAPESVAIAERTRSRREPLAILHLVLEGTCWAELPGRPPLRLEPGDLVAFPHGHAHRIGSDLLRPAVTLDHVLRAAPELPSIRFGGSGACTTLVCAWLALEHEVPELLSAALPDVFVAPLGRRPAGSWIQASTRHALAQAASGQRGSAVMSAKVAEVLFVETLCAYVETLSSDQTGWPAAVRDPQIGRCLSMMHGDPTRAWSVTELARAVGMSRSVLAARFTEMLGVPPMQYLKGWRLAVATRLLSDESSTLAAVATRIGYGSEAAFHRAFKRAHGISPGQWRRERARDSIRS